MNPFAARVTPSQQRRIDAGRDQLVHQWTTDASFKANNQYDLNVMPPTTHIDADGPVDVFLVTNTRPQEPIGDAWNEQAQRNNFKLIHERNWFTVRVPHSFYLRRRWCPCAVSCECVSTELTFLALGVIFGSAAMLIKFFV